MMTRIAQYIYIYIYKTFWKNRNIWYLVLSIAFLTVLSGEWAISLIILWIPVKPSHSAMRFCLYDSECFENILESFDMFGFKTFLIFIEYIFIVFKSSYWCRNNKFDKMKLGTQMKPLQCCNETLLTWVRMLWKGFSFDIWFYIVLIFWFSCSHFLRLIYHDRECLEIN